MAEWLLQFQNAEAVYLMLFLFLMAGAIGLPVPEDIPLILGGIAIHRGTTSPEMTFLVCYLGVIAGDLLVFSIGRLLGPSLFQQKWFKKRFPPRKVKDVKSSLEKRSLSMIFIARHLFYLRTATFLTCGAVKMNATRFVVSDAIAALISVPIMISIGYIFSEQLEGALAVAEKARIWSVLLISTLIAGYVLFYLRRKRIRKPSETTDETTEL